MFFSLFPSTLFCSLTPSLPAYLYGFRWTRADETKVTTKYINGLIELIHSNASGGDAGNAGAMEQPRKHFRRTLEYIASREYEGVVTEAKS